MEQLQEESINALRDRVTSKVGRCILSLQQYELLMKGLLASSHVAGFTDSIQRSRLARRESVSRMTLGQLIGELTNNYLTTTAREADNTPADGGDVQDPQRIYVAFRSTLNLTEEEYQQTTDALAQLVAIRNELVHHFLERYDLSDVEGCRVAERHLDGQLDAVAEHFKTLSRWVESTQRVRKAVTDFLTSADGKHWWMYGAVPGQAVDWSGAEIVYQLQDAELRCGIEGWTSLTQARSLIAGRWPDLTPKVYGCSSWRHVLHESKLFDVQKRQDAKTGGRQVWYRSKPGAA